MAHLLVRYHNEQFGRLMGRHLPNWKQLRQELNSTPLAHTDLVY
jgi:predicted metal-dependent hydrolase